MWRPIGGRGSSVWVDTAPRGRRQPTFILSILKRLAAAFWAHSCSMGTSGVPGEVPGSGTVTPYASDRFAFLGCSAAADSRPIARPLTLTLLPGRAQGANRTATTLLREKPINRLRNTESKAVLSEDLPKTNISLRRKRSSHILITNLPIRKMLPPEIQRMAL